MLALFRSLPAVALNQRQMITILVDDLRQHGAGAFKHRSAFGCRTARHRHHLFHHLMIKTAEQIGTLTCLIRAKPRFPAPCGQI